LLLLRSLKAIKKILVASFICSASHYVYSSSTSQKLVEEDYLYQQNGSFGIMIDCADISCCRSEECAYDTTNSETGFEIVEEKPPKKSVPWYV
jgi:hypothetical protein